VTSPANQPDQEAPRLDLSQLRTINPRDYGVRFGFGALISAVAAVVVMRFGPVAGGLFLAFPAILPATLTLLEKKEGLAQAVSDMRGAAVGSLGMVAFAVTGLLLMKGQPALALIAALIAWILAALASYLLLRLLARVLGEKQYLPEIATQEAASVIEALSGRGFTLGLAESCTGGTIAALLTDVPGAGKVIRGSIVTWNDETKADLLGLDPSLLATHDIVSAAVAKEMAHRAKKVLRADIGFAITGVEGRPLHGQPSGLTFLAVACPDERTVVRRYHDDHGAGRNRERDVRTAFELIQKSLEGEPSR